MRRAAPSCTRRRQTLSSLAVRESIFSIDVEDWFNLSGTGLEPPPPSWDALESRIERNFIGLLDIFSASGAAATCFFVGYFAKRFPHLVREAIARGHEIGSHSYHHRLAYELTPDEFMGDVRDARRLLEDISGRRVVGFRAPAFSVTERTPWFFDKLIEAGYEYDSSVFPAPHQTGGLATNAFAPHVVVRDGGRLVEFPITAVRVLGRPMCFFGGGYLRLFPYRVIRAMGKRALDEGRPIIFYVHPREIDPDQPRMALSRRRRFTCYVNLETTRPKIARILRDFPVTTFEKYLGRHGEQIEQLPNEHH
jgi:polysaccharide deacetylase family protein (PEP-CTERM system associated)